MPKRTDIKKILLIGSGPIVIGQGCEFDYSGTQACKVLREEGYEVVLINSNPATIMTDPETAARTYVEPLRVEYLEKIIAKERPDVCLPTMGGQTGLNLAVEAYEQGVFEKYDVELIGANYEAIKKAEDRKQFQKAMEKIGLELAKCEFAYTVPEALEHAKNIGYPVILRSSFTLGGSGSAICYNREELEKAARLGIDSSRINEITVEESIMGWKEYELEVMRDKNDNYVVICSIENLDAMGVHTGDSITVAPSQTLTDKEYQLMRDAGRKVISEIGVETGGSNIQFAIDPKTGRMLVIEMNPRVSRSSALASKATGFPIAKIAAKLAVGYTLDEIPNDITKYTPASFEPSIDYCVVKIPRFTFEKFEGVDSTLMTQMKSVGEAMSIGRTFKESFQKGLRSLETKRSGYGADGRDKVLSETLKTKKAYVEFFENAAKEDSLKEQILQKTIVPKEDRLFYLKYALMVGYSVEAVYKSSFVDPWFLAQIKQLVDFEKELLAASGNEAKQKEMIRKAKRYGYSDRQLGFLWEKSEKEVRAFRLAQNVRNVYKLVDTCAAEFQAFTPYLYSTYEEEDEGATEGKEKIIILGGGPNRIGQGIEFDYCCVHAAFALKELGFETLMVNSNPETVSTDYDTSDKLFFEPLTLEDVLNICDREKPKGVIVQLGGQTPLNLARGLQENGIKILGTSADAIDAAEDRDKFKKLLHKINLKQPANGIARTLDEAITIATDIGYPVVIRPSYVLGGRAMEIVYDEDSLRHYMAHAVDASDEHPVLIDKFLENASEVDVDLIGDGKTFVVGAVMQHIEEAGIHSGDSASVIPPYSLKKEVQAEIISKTKQIAKELNIKGLMNVQYAVKDDVIYCIEVNPRASRTAPFVSKSIGVPLAKLAAKVMGGKMLEELGFTEEITPSHVSVKESVFPFAKFPGVDIILSPEMKSTGEVMGIDVDFPSAFYKSQDAALAHIPLEGKVFISVKKTHREKIIPIAKQFHALGYPIVATEGTSRALKEKGIPSDVVKKIAEGRPNVADLIRNQEVQLVINTPSGKGPVLDEAKIRSLAVSFKIPCITTLSAAEAAATAIKSVRGKGLEVKALQDYHKKIVTVTH